MKTIADFFPVDFKEEDIENVGAVPIKDSTSYAIDINNHRAIYFPHKEGADSASATMYSRRNIFKRCPGFFTREEISNVGAKQIENTILMYIDFNGSRAIYEPSRDKNSKGLPKAYIFRRMFDKK